MKLTSLALCAALTGAAHVDHDEHLTPTAIHADEVSKPNSKPNLVFMLIDDLGWSDTEFGGSGTADFGFVRTPTMKSLKDESIKLERHYAYAWCAPSRSSLLSGRLPVHVNVNHSNPMAFIKSDPLSSGEGIPAGMKTIGTQLKSVGYETHYTGKWGVGFTWKEQWPMSRGFDSFFGFLHDSIDFWDEKLGNQSIEVPGGCEKAMRAVGNFDMAVDLIEGDSPAVGKNGTEWVDYQFLNNSLSIIEAHDASKPLFLLHSFHSIHAPLNAPAELYTGEYAPPPCTGKDAMRTCFKRFGAFTHDDRRSYAAMITFTDGAIGQIKDALQKKGMWANTLMVVSSDNGGPQYMSPRGYQLFGSGNNLPLRGGKTSEFEGGVRVNSFVAGGLLPATMRGKVLDDIVHFADWYATFSHLAGADIHDEMAEENRLPQPDSLNMWPLLSGKTTVGPRTELQISPATLYDGKWKLLTGADPGSINEHTTPGFVPFDRYAVGYLGGNRKEDAHGAVYASWDALCGMLRPKLIAKLSKADASVLNADAGTSVGLGMLLENVKKHLEKNNRPMLAELTSLIADPVNFQCSGGLDCRVGCLFNIEEDPSESHDVGPQNPAILTRMKERHAVLSKRWTVEEPWGIFNPIRNGEDPRAKGTVDECVGNACTSMDKCHEFTYDTGFYSWAGEASTDSTCKSFCHSKVDKPWTLKCTSWKHCQGCDECSNRRAVEAKWAL